MLFLKCFPYAYLHVYKENGLLFLVQDAFYKNVEWLYKQEFWFNITSYTEYIVMFDMYHNNMFKYNIKYTCMIWYSKINLPG